MGGCLCLSLQTRNLTHLRASSPPPSFPFTLLHWLTGEQACQPLLLCGLLSVFSGLAVIRNADSRASPPPSKSKSVFYHHPQRFLGRLKCEKSWLKSVYAG